MWRKCIESLGHGGRSATNVAIQPIVETDLDAAAEAIASGEAFRQYGLTRHRARELLIAASGDTVVARLADEVVGVANFWTDGTMPTPAYLRLLAVREGRRSAGVGRALLHCVDFSLTRGG